jgi:hypothetical protein
LHFSKRNYYAEEEQAVVNDLQTSAKLRVQIVGVLWIWGLVKKEAARPWQNPVSRASSLARPQHRRNNEFYEG